MKQFIDKLRSAVSRFGGNSDLGFVFGLFGAVLLLVVPVHKDVLSVLLVFSIAISLLILLTVIYVKEPPEFSVFPTILLAVTLYRLGLNVASTRLILLDGDAGSVIQSFGTFVVGGNYVVGSVIFLILVIINFVVITKGAGRIAEVTARFTLDAMPGKQMSIDAEMNSGVITEAQALEKREKIQKDADFYGSMDGASKFVRGDAVAGILITLVNILGGLAIGMLQRDLALIDALQTYTLLTVGDGLVTQIPALITSTAAGIIVTRATSDDNMGTDINKQLTGRPQASLIAVGILIILGFLPGLPTTPFMIIGSLLVAVSILVRQRNARQEAQEAAAEDEAAQPEERPEDYLRVDLLEVQVGYQLVPLVDANQGGDLIERIVQIRKVAAMDMGFVAPPVRVRDSTELSPNEYQIRVKGNPVARGEL